MKTRPDRGTQQMKQCVYSITCDCGRCYIGDTSRPFEAAINSTNITGHRIWWKIRISPTCSRRRPQNMSEWSEGLADGTKHHIQELQGIRPHVADGPSNQSTQTVHLSHLDFRYHSRNKNSNSVQCRLGGNILFLVLVAYGEFVYTLMTSVIVDLWCETSYV
jgi:hypothetical protein